MATVSLLEDEERSTVITTTTFVHHDFAFVKETDRNSTSMFRSSFVTSRHYTRRLLPSQHNFICSSFRISFCIASSVHRITALPTHESPSYQSHPSPTCPSCTSCFFFTHSPHKAASSIRQQVEYIGLGVSRGYETSETQLHTTRQADLGLSGLSDRRTTLLAGEGLPNTIREFTWIVRFDSS